MSWCHYEDVHVNFSCDLARRPQVSWRALEKDTKFSNETSISISRDRGVL